MMNALRISLLVLGALPVSACRDRAPQAPATTTQPPAAVAAPAQTARPQLAARALAPSRSDGVRRRAETSRGADVATGAEAEPPRAALLLVSDRSLSRNRALITGRARARSGTATITAPGPGQPVGSRHATESELPRQDVTTSTAGVRAIRPVAILVLADHRVDPGTGLEHTSSLMYGAGFEATTRGWLSVRGELTTGTLASGQVGVRDRTVTDARLDLGVRAFPWLTLLAGGGLRVYKQDAQENWRFLRVGAEARFPLAVDALTGSVRLTLAPLVSRTTNAPAALSPSFALAGASGLRLTQGRLSVGVEYAVESYTFPSSGGITRLEQFSALKLSCGLNLPW